VALRVDFDANRKGRLRSKRKVWFAREQTALIRRGHPGLHGVRGAGIRTDRNRERTDRKPRQERRRIHTRAAAQGLPAM
jgi:hypothetical protein